MWHFHFWLEVSRLRRITDAIQAKLFSDIISVCILFYCGYALANYSGFRPWLGGLGMVLIALCFFILTLLLGG